LLILSKQIHWFSIINSCVIVLLLTGFLATILSRVLKADFVKYSKEDGEWCSSSAAGCLPGYSQTLHPSSSHCMAPCWADASICTHPV
jgi:hypothetical protein